MNLPIHFVENIETRETDHMKSDRKPKCLKMIVFKHFGFLSPFMSVPTFKESVQSQCKNC